MLFTKLSDLAGLQGDFHHWLPSQASPFSQGNTWLWLQHLSCGPHPLSSPERPQHAEARGKRHDSLLCVCEGTFPACSITSSPLSDGDPMLLQTWSLLWALFDRSERTQPGVTSLKRMACFACGGQVRVLLCAWCCAVQDGSIAVQG